MWLSKPNLLRKAMKIFMSRTMDMCILTFGMLRAPYIGVGSAGITPTSVLGVGGGSTDSCAGSGIVRAKEMPSACVDDAMMASWATYICPSEGGEEVVVLASGMGSAEHRDEVGHGVLGKVRRRGGSMPL